jgi:serine/threonine protein kinase
MLKQGHRLGEYFLVDRIGNGTFGEVWRASHNAWSDQIAAIKIPSDPEYVRNLQRKGIAVRRLNHRGIVQAINSDPFGDPPYLVMEYVPGNPDLIYCLSNGFITAESKGDVLDAFRRFNPAKKTKVDTLVFPAGGDSDWQVVMKTIASESGGVYKLANP